jgi:capsular polysaccharide biosynthesis protein
VRQWWILVAGVAAGVVLGAIYSLSGGSVYQASVLVAPGQPFTPNGSPVLSYQSSPRAIHEIVTSQSALERAAQRAGVPVSELRGNVSTQTVSTGLGSTASRGSALIRVTVQGHKRQRVEDAANALGEIVVADTTGPYVEQSIRAYQNDIARFNRRLVSVEALIDAYSDALERENLAPLDKLVLVNQYDSAIARQGNLNDRIAATEQALSLARNIMIAQIISPGAAEKTTARSRRNSILVGALIGLVVGIVVAIVVDWRASRSRPA